MFRLSSLLIALIALSDTGSTSRSFANTQNPAGGTLPTDQAGKPLNLDFELGSLKDWTVDGAAFKDALIEGDAVGSRRSDMKSEHQGKFWVGSYERTGDVAQGTLTSATFKVTKPWASFQMGGGSHPGTRVELIRNDSKAVIFEARGDDTENLKPVMVDLAKFQNLEIVIRVVDNDSGPWGHVNFDNFRLHDQKPSMPERPRVSTADDYANSGLSPTDAAKAMTAPPGFKITLFAGEPDVVQPIAMAIDDRGRVWVAEAYSYPHRVAPEKARDRILIFEDADGDGKFDKRTVFADKLNLVSGLEVGFGGVFVGAAPEFLFIPDKDGDDKPDGPPVVLLDGWGQHDTHETLNSFAWGPDGWLYGCHGVFTFSNVGKPGTPAKDRTPINAGIWRYHPKKHKFEVFAHGTSNPWGVDWDERGQAFLTSCVIPHLYHVIQGGRYERQAGGHYNPYTYDDIKTVADHRHYVGGNPHAGNGRSDSMGGGHAHSGAMICQGEGWPEEYRGSILMNNIHGARLNRDTFSPKGSGFVGSHAPDFLMANDSWSQIVSLKQGPDGSIFMIDWYDKNQCHRVEDGAHDRTNGRIFKVSIPGADPKKKFFLNDPRKLPELSFVKSVSSPNEWVSRHARKHLQESGGSPLAKRMFETLLTSPSSGLKPPIRLRLLWALHAMSGLNEEVIKHSLASDDAHLRAWTIQLAMEDETPSGETLATFARMAKSDPSPVVRLYLASALQRMPPASRWVILEGLVSHDEDETDPNLPFMVWYAAEPLAVVDASRALQLAVSSKLSPILPFMTRRIAAIGSDQAIRLLVEELGRVKPSAQKLAILEGLELSLKGRRQVAMPQVWPKVFEALAADSDASLRSRATALGVTFGDSSAMKSLRNVLTSEKAGASQRQEALAALLKARDPQLPATLLPLIQSDSTLRAAAIRGLASYEDSSTSKALLAIYAKLPSTEKRDALNTMASRVSFATALLTAVGEKRIAAADLSADLIRQLRNLKDASINDQIAKVWGTVRETDSNKARLIADFKARVKAGYQQNPDPMLGRAMFVKTCAQCHTLFATGGKVGPELTGSNRADLDYILSNVLDPNALIGKDYLAHVIATKDGRVLTGIIKNEDKDAITLLTANETLTVPLGDVQERKPSEKSMMPDDLWTPLTDFEVRSLIAYLASPSQVPALATPETASTFFNGRDLTGWQGDPKLWTVENGEIVGKTAGLKRNEFLRSDLAATDFKLTVRVKLLKNEGNSGIQFRSVALPDGEMKGDQADVGAGWWGKLYEENGRGLLWKESGEAHVKPGEWNTYEVVAAGSKITTKINGKLCVDLDDPSGARRGIFAFQLHSGGPTEVRFKDIKLELLGK
ncbi:MAG: hypothetical protein JWN86_4635 [Planctomycetota bacterium]|nr:hypothetical protein [Planctomycetota bacterium]